MEFSSIEKQAQPQHYNLRKRKRNPSKDQKENEMLPRSKIPRREKCLPILPPESKITKLYFSLKNFFIQNNFSQFSAWSKIFGYLDTVTIHTKVSLVSKYFLDLVRNSQNLAGELRISTKYLENVFKLNKASLSLLSNELNSKMEEMLKRWPKVETVKFTKISTFEKHEWLRNLSRTNFERDIFFQFKDLKDFQKAWDTKILKEVSLSDFMEEPTFLKTSKGKEQPEQILEYVRPERLFRLERGKRIIEVRKIQYDSINVTEYDAIRDIRMYMPKTETLKFMAKRMKKLEHLQMKIGFSLPFFWPGGGHWPAIGTELLSKDWQKAFCDFLKSQEETLTEITLLFPCPICEEGYPGGLSNWWGPTGAIFDYTKIIYESINNFCPNVDTITVNWPSQSIEFFPYPHVGPWKYFKTPKTVSVECYF